MKIDTIPGCNRWLGCAAIKPGVTAGALDGRLDRSQHREGRTEVWAPRGAPGEVSASYIPLNADPRLLPERTGAYIKQGGGSMERHRSASVTPQLGAAISRGYGRAPTAFVYTSADTLLSTTSYQSPSAALQPRRAAVGACAKAAAATATATARGAHLQAFAFTCNGGQGIGGSASAPASPLGSRTLLYTRAAAEYPAPAVDLLDRMTLLRRMAPTTGPAARPQQLTAAAQHFTAAPTPQWEVRAGAHGMASAPPTAAAAAAVGTRRWAWDDSVLGTTSGRPIAAMPAPGWRYCGDVVGAVPAEGMGTNVTAAASSQRNSGGLTLNLSVSAGGGSVAGVAQQQHEGNEDVVLVLRSPRPHHLHMEEDAAAWDDADAVLGRRSSDGGGRLAFRPPGPLQHKFGNKPALRPHSAPSAAERARAAGLRGCGCHRSPRHPSSGGTSSFGQVAARAGSTPRRQVAWADEDAVAAVAFVTRRPRSAAATAAPPAYRQQQQEGSKRWAANMPASAATPRAQLRCSTGSGVGAGATTVSVTSGRDGDVVVISSPRARSAGLGLASEEEEREEVVVVATSPRRGRGAHGSRGGDGCSNGCSGGGSDILVVHHEHQQASPKAKTPAAAAQQLPGEAAAAAAGGHTTRLSVSVPTGGGSSFSIRADATSAGKTAAAAPSGHPPSGGPSSPIKAWRQPAAAATPPQTASAAHQAYPSLSHHHHQPAAAAMAAEAAAAEGRRKKADGADLQRLEGEMRRREKSFNELLGELDRISAKCAQLTGDGSGGNGSSNGNGGSCSRGSSGAQAGSSSGGRGAQPAVPADLPKQARPAAHTTHQFDGGVRPATEERRAAHSPAAASGRDSRGNGAAAAASEAAHDADWGWEKLLAFEEQIRAQQRKLVEQGVLPAEYS